MNFSKAILSLSCLLIASCGEFSALQLFENQPIVQSFLDSDGLNSSDLKVLSSTSLNKEFDIESLNKITCQSSSEEINRAIIDLVNYTRREGFSCGGVKMKKTNNLVYSGLLYRASKTHSNDMATNLFVSHTGSDGSSAGERLNKVGYDFRTAGENVAAGQISIVKVYLAWLKSEGHCRNLVEQKFQEIAVSCTYNENSTYKTYWTMALASPRV